MQEPVPAPDAAIEAGSDYVDYAEVKRELGQIAVGWLGDGGSAPVAAMIQAARPSIDDFVSLIDTIRGMTIEGIDPSAVQAMAREMHHHAAERLCGA